MTEIRAFGRGRANIEGLCRTARDLGLAAKAPATAEDAVSDADLIVTSVTYSADMEPFLDAGWLKPGAFAAVTDLAAPWIKDSLGHFELIVIDDMEQEASMPDKLAPAALIAGDITGLVRGHIHGRTSDDERTAFIFRTHPLGGPRPGGPRLPPCDRWGEGSHHRGVSDSRTEWNPPPLLRRRHFAGGALADFLLVVLDHLGGDLARVKR